MPTSRSYSAQALYTIRRVHAHMDYQFPISPIRGYVITERDRTSIWEQDGMAAGYLKRAGLTVNRGLSADSRYCAVSPT
jgi:hypothetical protein